MTYVGPTKTRRLSIITQGYCSAFGQFKASFQYFSFMSIYYIFPRLNGQTYIETSPTSSSPLPSFSLPHSFLPPPSLRNLLLHLIHFLQHLLHLIFFHAISSSTLCSPFTSSSTSITMSTSSSKHPPPSPHLLLHPPLLFLKPITSSSASSSFLSITSSSLLYTHVPTHTRMHEITHS